MKPSRNLWPLGLVITFVLFFSGLATVIVIASTHRESLVSDNYYEQELKFQDQIDAAARAKTAGASLQFDPAAGRLAIALPAAQLTQKLSGHIELYRPSAPELDRQFQLAPRADGTQILDLSRLAAGLWRVRVSWSAGGQDYFLNQKIVIAAK